MSAFVLAARHVPYAVTQILDDSLGPLERPTVGHFGWRIFSPAPARLQDWPYRSPFSAGVPLAGDARLWKTTEGRVRSRLKAPGARLGMRRR